MIPGAGSIGPVRWNNAEGGTRVHQEVTVGFVVENMEEGVTRGNGVVYLTAVRGTNMVCLTAVRGTNVVCSTDRKFVYFRPDCQFSGIGVEPNLQG